MLKRGKMIKKISISIILMVIILAITMKIEAHEIEYKGKEGGIVITSENFLSSFGNLMPGDIISDYATIKNSTDSEIEVLFKVEPIDSTEEGAEQKNRLLEIIKLKVEIERDGKTKEVYNGKMKAEGTQENISLGKYKKGYDGKFKFTIEIPLELTNEQAAGGIMETKWTFSVKDVVESEENNEKNNEENENNVNDEENKNENSENNIEKEIIVAPANFLKGFESLTPGDIINDYAIIKNSTDDPVEIFFKVEPIDSTEEIVTQTNELLKRINLKVEVEEDGVLKEVYNGKMKLEGGVSYISLGKYKQGYDGKFKFTIVMPPELANEQINAENLKIKWSFSVAELSDEAEENTKTAENSDNNADKTVESNQVKNSKTGDNIIFYALVLIAVTTLRIVISKKKNGNNNET